MRLTLRTLLAFMDDILEPGDAQEMAKKVEESEVASNLMHRIRDVVRRLRLGAPSLSDQGPGLDPNTVAEYLDNTLPSDQVPDFEKVCLESDVHLAEVASCHQILALVLGEPAEVDPVSRQRMYQLPDLVAAQVKATQDAAATASVAGDGQPGTPVQEPPRRPKPEVPEYLRQEVVAQRRRWSWLTSAAVVAAIVVGGWAVLDRMGAVPRVGRMAARGSGTPEARQDQGVEESLKPRDEMPPEEQPTEARPAQSPQLPKVAERMDVAADGPLAKSVGSEAEARSAPTRPAASSPTVEPSAQLPEGKEVGTDSQSKSAEDSPSKSAPAAQMASLPKTPAFVQPSSEPEQKPSQPLLKEAQPPGAVHEGQYISPKEVLLIAVGEPPSWIRVADQAVLSGGTQCLSLPTYRPVILAGEDLYLQLIDATRIAILPADVQREKVPGISVEYGKLVLTTERNARAKLFVVVGERGGVIQFAEIPATVAIEVGRRGPSGADPETQPAPLAGMLYVTRGKAIWQEVADPTAVAIGPQMEFSLADKSAAPEAMATPPKWIDASTISLLDQRASATVERELAVKADSAQGRSVLVILRELAEHRQKEVRWLAMRCMSAIGDFELLVTALDDPKQKAMWPDYIEELRSAVGRGPTAAGQVRTALESVYGAAARGQARQTDGTTLYELLWRYQTPELTAQDAAQLVQYLDHETLAVRVLAFANLKQITGRGFYYQPEDTPAKREPSVQKWKDRLKASPTLRMKAAEETEAAAGVPQPVPVPKSSAKQQQP